MSRCRFNPALHPRRRHRDHQCSCRPKSRGQAHQLGLQCLLAGRLELGGGVAGCGFDSRCRRAALIALRVSGELRNTAGSGRGTWNIARSKAPFCRAFQRSLLNCSVSCP
jgi:hypothetical protein